MGLGRGVPGIANPVETMGALAAPREPHLARLLYVLSCHAVPQIKSREGFSEVEGL